MKNKYKVLFLSKRNEDRSIIAEALLNHWGKDKFVAYSAGTMPSGKVHPMAKSVLKKSLLNDEGDYRSKSIEEFEGESAPEMDFVITVCDEVHGESVPEWPGHTITAKWNVEDPIVSDGELCFHRSFMCLQNRIQVFTQLPIASLDHLSKQQEVDRLADLKPA